MPTLSQYPRNIQIRAINKLIAKYGHDGILETPGNVAEPCRVLFGKYKLSFGGETLIINNNYKLHVKPIGKLLFDTQPDPTSEITVNGSILNVVNVRKIAPDGANPIVWEMEAMGDVIPYDTITIVNPSIVAPTADQENYPTTGNSGGFYAVNMVSTDFDTTGGADTLVGMEWEISTNDIFTTVVASVTGYIGGATWNTGNVLSRDTNYWARVRHTGVVSGTSDWSPTIKFSLDEFYTAPVTRIMQPQILTGKNVTTNILQNENYSTGGKSGPTGGKWHVTLTLTTYDPIAPTGACDRSYWEIATDEAFTTIVYARNGEGTSGGADDETGAFYPDKGVLIMDPTTTYPGYHHLLGATTYYARGKYISVDPFESEWSPTLMFKCS